ncbi:MAG: cellulase family glycosylhydrolase [Deltaproteobacteria bacterium]|nr:cellulase family glycosylhydrolase [Deltaproteobacteria bacterium]
MIHVPRPILLSFLAALCAVLPAAACGPGSAPSHGPDTVPDVEDLSADTLGPGLPRLRVQGTSWVTEEGTPVVLRGANLGSWGFHEPWITAVDYDLAGRALTQAEEAGLRDEARTAILAIQGQDGDWLTLFEAALADQAGAEAAAAVVAAVRDCLPGIQDDSDRPLFQALETRFGVAVRDELVGIFMDAWIRDEDLAWLAAQGFNLVRVPLGYRTLTAISHLSPPTELVWNEAAFARIDGLLDRCRAHGLYAILDLQESPGGHNDYSGTPRLYDDETMQDLTVQLWEELSLRYRDRDEVAAYSLLAEPYGAPDPAARDAMYDRLLRAIRATGDLRPLVIHDGFFGMDTLPHPEDLGWDQVVYSTHLFQFDFDELSDWEGLIELFYPVALEQPFASLGVPLFIGSFSTRHDAPWAYDAARLLVSYFEDHGWSWSVWTLKRIDDPIGYELFGKTSSYGLLGGHADFVRPDVCRDDADTLRARFASYADYPFTPNDALLDALREPWAPR